MQQPTGNEEVGQKEITQSKLQDEGFDPGARPPILKFCKLHQQAKMVGKPDKSKAKSRNCPCCGETLNKTELNMWADNISLGYLGCGIPLFFEFIKYGAQFLLLTFLVQGISTMIDNSTGDYCTQYFRYQQAYCIKNFINLYSAENRRNLGISSRQTGLNLLLIFVMMGSVLIFRRHQNRISNKIDKDNITPADFTIKIKNLPTMKYQDNDLIAYLEQQCNVKVKKIVQAYNIGNFITLQRKINKLQQIIYILEKQKEDGVSISTSQLVMYERQLKQYQIEMKEYDIKAEKDQPQQQSMQSKQKVIILNIQQYIIQNTGFQMCGIAYVSLTHDIQVEKIITLFHRSLWERFFQAFMSSAWRKTKPFYGRYLDIVRAEEPSDIFWENLHIDDLTRFKTIIVTATLTAGLIVACFFILRSISNEQRELNTNVPKGESPGFQAQLLSIVMAFFILFINNLLAIVVRKFSLYEKHSTYTSYNISVTMKLAWATFFNTSLLYYIIFLDESDNLYKESGGFNPQKKYKFMVDGGLNSDIVWITFVIAGTPLLAELFNPFYIQTDTNNSQLNQLQANAIFEGPQLDIPKAYSNVLKTIMLSCFYVYLLPIVSIIGCGGLILYYILNKYLLLNRYSRPQALGSSLSYALTGIFLEFIILVFAIGNIIFEQLLYDDINGWTIAGIVFASIYWVFPIDKLFSNFTDVNRQTTREDYDSQNLFFIDDYDRLNPVTQSKAIEDWLAKIDEFAGLDESERQKQAQQRKQQQVGGYQALQNYALMRPSQGNMMQQLNPFNMMRQITQPNHMQNQMKIQQQQKQQMVLVQQRQMQNNMRLLQQNQNHKDLTVFQQARNNIMQQVGDLFGNQHNNVGNQQFNFQGSRVQYNPQPNINPNHPLHNVQQQQPNQRQSVMQNIQQNPFQQTNVQQNPNYLQQNPQNNQGQGQYMMQNQGFQPGYQGQFQMGQPQGQYQMGQPLGKYQMEQQFQGYQPMGQMQGQYLGGQPQGYQMGQPQQFKNPAMNQVMPQQLLQQPMNLPYNPNYQK